MRMDRSYWFPTREAFRYHFREPPGAPQQHEETKRIQSILKPTRTNIRHYWDLQPMTSERTELEHQMAPEVLRKDAPFGNDSTPSITLKIIGGRQVPVIEKHPVYDNDYAGSRIQPLRPIADKPNHLDPRIHGDNPGGYYSKDVQYVCCCHCVCQCGQWRWEGDDMFSHPLEHKGFDFAKFYKELGDQPTNYVNKRPDSKDVVRGQFKALPPIQQNRTRNDLSTVFEAEPWTGNKNPSLAHDTEYKQNYFLGRDLDREMEQQHSNAGKDFYFVTESERKNLMMLLPRNVLLPVDPIKLTREQETNLCKLICNELNRFDPKELREVYIECSQHDKELRGFCGIEILDNSLRRHRAYLPESLRMVAAQFVDPNYPGKVNYERTLSFIGSALHLNSNGQLESREYNSQHSNSLSTTPRDKRHSPAPKQEDLVDSDKDALNRSQEKQPKYYLQNGETFKTGSLFRDREVAKLLRLVEQELSKNTYAMDWTRWQNSFYERDRDHRDTLSAAQIKDICYDQKLPLSDSVINQILNLCEDNNRDGQYRWHSFLEFLQRVRPSNTGLPIPVSKRPLEYAKHYPEPGPNWPRTDADTERRGTSPRRDISPRRGEQRRDERGQTPLVKVATPQERNEKKEADNREANSPDRCRSRERLTPQGRTSYHDKPTLPRLRLNSPSPINKTPPPTSPRERYRPARYQLDVHPVRADNTDPYNIQDRYQNDNDRFDSNETNYKGWRSNEQENWRDDAEEKGSKQWRGVDKWADKWNTNDYDRRRMSYAESPSGYQPSWQQNAQQQRSISPPYQKRGVDRDNFRRDERHDESEYERHWKKWAYKSYREPIEVRRVPSRYQRPKSYVEPPRKISFPNVEASRRRPNSYRDDIRIQEQPTQWRSPSRLQTPVRRTQSLSPVRNMSPVRGQPQRYTFRDPNGAQTYRDYTSNRQQYPHEYMTGYNIRYNDRDDYQQRDGRNSYRDDYQQRDGRNSYRDDYQQRDDRNSYRDGFRQGDGPRGGGRDGEQHRDREQQINQLSQQLHSLESKYEVTKEAISSRDKPWLDRYLKMAQALYDSDISNKGSLPRKDVMAIVNQYNNAFSLKLDIDRANMLSISPENLDKSGNIILRSFLANLSADRISYKV